MSATEGELVEVSMVTEVVEEPQKETSSEIDTVTSSVEVAMEMVSDKGSVTEEAQQTRLVCLRWRIIKVLLRF